MGRPSTMVLLLARMIVFAGLTFGTAITIADSATPHGGALHLVDSGAGDLSIGGLSVVNDDVPDLVAEPVEPFRLIPVANAMGNAPALVIAEPPEPPRPTAPARAPPHPSR